MYNIKQAASRAGVTVPVLRAWERRYGIVAPERTASGYRQFDDEAIARVRTMRELVDAGWSPSAAAAAIVAGSAPAIALTSKAAATDAASGPQDGRAASRAGEALRVADGLVAAARVLDPVAAEHVLDDVFARGSFERVAGDLVFPALRRLGDAWASGEVGVAGEHLASHAVLRRLALALDAAGTAVDPGADPGVVVVGLPHGSRHELGALAFAVAVRRAGLAVAYLGPDLPTEDWVAASEHAAAAVIGVVTARDRRPALEVATRLRAAYPGMLVAFGGRAAPSQPGVMALDGSLEESVLELRAALAPGG